MQGIEGQTMVGWISKMRQILWIIVCVLIIIGLALSVGSMYVFPAFMSEHTSGVWGIVGWIALGIAVLLMRMFLWGERK